MKNKTNRLRTIQYIVLIFLTFITLYPFSLLITTSLKTQKEYMKSSIAMPSVPQISNYATVWKRSNIFSGFKSSTVITVSSLIILIFFGSLAAYALTKMNFAKAKKYQLIFLAPMILPIQVIAIPIYLIFSKVHLLNSFIGISFAYVATGLPLVIFIMTSFMKTIPTAINESAKIDGAGEFQVFVKIMLPLLKPVLATVVIISGLGIWNDFFLPLLLISDSTKKTLPLKIYDFMGQYSSNWPLICACIIYVLLPIVIVYLCMRKYIVQGIVAGAIKE